MDASPPPPSDVCSVRCAARPSVSTPPLTLGNSPVFWVEEYEYLLICIVVAAVTFAYLLNLGQTDEPAVQSNPPPIHHSLVFFSLYRFTPQSMQTHILPSSWYAHTGVQQFAHVSSPNNSFLKI